MASLPYEEQVYTHYATKPYSIDPFNEVGIPAAERDSLLVKDFLLSYEALQTGVAQGVNQRYFNMGANFGG